MKSRFYINKKGEQVDFTIKVSTCPNLRCDFENILIAHTKEILRKIFDDFVIDFATTSLLLEYPERWSNLNELRSLPSRIMLCFPNIEEVVIKTHSSALLGSVHEKHTEVIDSPVEGYYWTPDEFKGLRFPDINELVKLNNCS